MLKCLGLLDYGGPAGTTFFSPAGLALAQSPAPQPPSLALTAQAQESALAMARINAAGITQGARLDTLGSATQAALPTQLTNGSAATDLKKDLVASGVLRVHAFLLCFVVV